MKVLPVIALAVAAAGFAYAAFQLHQPARTTPAQARAANGHARTDDAEPRARRPDDLAAFAELRQHVANLSAEVAALRAQKSARESDPQLDSGAPPDPTDPETEAKFREERRVYMENVKQDFFDEPRDANWSSATYNAILEALEANELRDAASSIECRSQTCRVEIADNGPETGQRMPLAVLKLGQTLPKIEYDHVDDGNGHRRTVLYMSRYDDTVPAAAAEPPR
ncbi:MAG: hypothetical protein JW940_22370 [Polyangiaceae bacterium]|nr:hypothetical protein [Polyangiaceae bacterium]